MGSMRRPKKPGAPVEESAELDGGEGEPDHEEGESLEQETMEQPFSQPPPRDYGNDTKGVEVRPRMADMNYSDKDKPSEPPPKDDFDMKKWSNDTVNKLDKFGKKRR